MAIRPKGATVAPAATTAPATVVVPAVTRRIRPAATAAPAAEAPATPAAPTRIATARQRATIAPETVPATPAAAQVPEGDDWMHAGDDAAAIAARLAAEKEAGREEKRARGYWPITFSLIPPSADHPDRYQADIILLDSDVPRAYWRHTLRNARTGQWDVHEPCPKEWDSCPLCPPSGERDSVFVMDLTALNINGYTYRRGARAGTHVPITKELVCPMYADHQFFHELHREHGSLRGIQLTMTRSDRFIPQIGTPTYVGKFTDEQIEAYIREQGMWTPKLDREGVQVAEADWMMHPFNYSEFRHRPSGADLRTRYANGGSAPIGATAANAGDNGQWGGSRYANTGATAGQRAGAAPVGGAGRSLDDLEDDVPF